MYFFLKNNIIFILYFLSYSLTYSKDIMFDNFEKQNESSWQFISDSVMGGKSYGKASFLSEQGSSFIRLAGYVSLDNNGGFIQVRRKLTNKENRITNGIKIVIRGNNLNYYIHLRTKFTILPWQYYQAAVRVKENWKEALINIKDFKASGVLLPKTIKPKNIKSIAIVAFGKEHKAEVDVKEIIFY